MDGESRRQDSHGSPATRLAPGRRTPFSESAAQAANVLLDDRLRPVSQPIVDLASGHPVAEELLAMVAHPSGAPRPEPGLVSSLDIDRWIVQRAAYSAAYGRRVHVGVSARSVRSRGFMAHVERALVWSAADPASLTFEIDDRVAACESRAARRFAGELRQVGAQLAINDFALRHPRPGYLRQLAPVAVKIDPWLVRDVASDGHSAATVAVIVEVARLHDMQTIAEGVYDQETRAMLRSLGVDRAQGYHRQRRS